MRYRMRRTITLVQEYDASPADYGTHDPVLMAEMDRSWDLSEIDLSTAETRVEVLEAIADDD